MTVSLLAVSERDCSSIFTGRSLGCLARRPVAAESLLARSRPERLMGKEIVGLSPGDLLMLSCLHGNKDRWNSIEALLGLALQIRDVTRGATPESWREILTAAREAGCSRRVSVGVAHACRVLGLPAPPEVADAIAGDRIARFLLALAHAGQARLGLGGEPLAGTGPGPSPPRIRSRPASGMELVRLVRPGPADWQWIALPRHAEWLYFFLRPVRLAVRWAKRL